MKKSEMAATIEAQAKEIDELIELNKAWRIKCIEQDDEISQWKGLYDGSKRAIKQLKEQLIRYKRSTEIGDDR